MSGEIHKDQGNSAFKAEDYLGAVGHYTAAVVADPSNSTYPLNRAAAYLKLGKYADAERDCTTALRLNGNNVKGWYRRGQARLALENFAQARADFEQVLRLDDKNEAARQELKKIEKLLKSPPTQPKISSSSLSPKRRRVPITIIDPSSSETSRASDANRSEISITGVTEANSGVNKLNITPKPRSFQEAKQSRTADSRVAGGGIFRPNGQHTVFRQNSTPASSQDGFIAPKPDTVASQHTTRPPTLPMPNKLPATASITLFDLSRRWESAKTHRDRWTLLAENVPPSSLPQLFKTSLETSFLMSMLGTFHGLLLEYPDATELHAAVHDYMIHLPQVPRFGTIVLLMSSEERRLVQSVWDYWSNRPADAVEIQAKAAWKLA